MSFSWLMTNFLAAFLLPPLNGLLPAVLGFWLLRRRPRLGRCLLGLGLALLWALALPVVAKALLRPLEAAHPPLPAAARAGLPVDAVVILGAGRYREAPEFGGGDDVRQLALERLRYGALLAREAGKPILVTGGKPDGEGISEAEAMKAALERDFRVPVRWTEETSANTRENAVKSAAILLPQGVGRIALVTHAFHMPRAVAAFEAAGFTVTPAPTAYFAQRQGLDVFDFLPAYPVMRESGFALHEMIGLVWYRWRG